MTTDELTSETIPTATTTGSPPVDLTFVQPGVRPRVGNIVHLADDQPSSTCRVGLVEIVYPCSGSPSEALRSDPDAVDSMIQAVDPRGGQRADSYRYDASGKKVVSAGFAPPQKSWHRPGSGCPFGK